jgi:hypothetical protein
MTKKSGYMTLWHVTHKTNVASILETGIDPAYSKSDIKRIWLVQWGQLPYVLWHISNQKRLPVWEMVAFKVVVFSAKTTHFNRKVYTSTRCLAVSSYMTSDQVMASVDRQREYLKTYKPQELIKPPTEDLSWLSS